MKNNKNSGIGGFFAEKGFYAALAVCILGAVAAAWVSVDRSISSANEQSDVPKVENRVIADENYDAKDSIFASEDVGKPKEDVKIEKEPETPEAEKDTFHFVKKTPDFTMPLEGEIIGTHSAGELVKYEALGEWRTHDGIDIAGDVGAEIRAVSDGKITAVTNDPLWGTVVEISHNGGLLSIYSGLAPEVSVAVGDEVKGGDIIGTLGETNLAEAEKASHLHFAMKQNGKFIDPKTKIK